MIREGWRAWAWSEGGYLPCESVPVTDVGFRLGYSAFETMAVREGVPLFLQEHLSRLVSTAGFLGLSCDAAALEAGKIRSLLAGLSGMARLYITGGDELSLKISRVYLLLENRPFPIEESYRKGWKLRTQEGLHWSLFGGRKTGSYAAQVKVNLESHLKYHVDEALLFNEKEELVSAAFSNVFFIRGDIISTPPIASGARDGVIREWLMNRFTVREEVIHRYSMNQVDELFLTNSRIGIMGACELDGRSLAMDRSLAIYREYVSSIS
ncbi:MAG: aminotransferase class IV [Chthoniobacteraceae bacterium]